METDHRHLLVTYIEGWKSGNQEKILSPLTEDCLIIESHGPTYRGKEKIKQWITYWNQTGGQIKKWDLYSFYSLKNELFAEWFVDLFYDYGRAHEAFQGLTIAHVSQGKISCLKEYRMTADPYEWIPP